tara:strand:- start:15001 stop:15579 length:579 start_codon:yes stop_codon:yes gene_type:complete
LQSPKTIYLASSSPRRVSILKQFGYDVRITQHHFDETSLSPHDFNSYRLYVKEIAKQKALSANHQSKDFLLAADTIVVFNKHIFGKPTNFQEAVSYLSCLQGNIHSVISAFCLILPQSKHIILKSSLSYVRFNPLSTSQIESYIKTYKPFDKAGAYGIQECPSYFIDSYTGSIYTIIGLPIYLLNKTIKDSH